MARTALFRKIRRHTQASLKQEGLRSGGISRREMLKTTATVAAALPFSGYFAKQVLGAPKTKPSIAIIGAGLAGLVTAYRLSKAGVPCEIFEAASRAGGRVFTKRKFNRDGMFCELGAELVDTIHTEMIALCRELGLDVEAFAPGDAGMESELFHFGGKIHTHKQLAPAFAPFAKALQGEIKRLFPDGKMEVSSEKVSPAVRRFDQLSLAEYLASLQGKVDKWVLDLIDVAYNVEYGLDTGEQSALNLLVLIDTEPEDGIHLYGESDEAYRVRGGSGALVDALVRKLQGKVPIHYGHRLLKVADKASQLQLTFGTRGATVEVKSEQVVCTLPFSVLRKVEGVLALDLHPGKRRCIQELGYGTNTKLMLGFQTRAWRKHHESVPASIFSVSSDLRSQAFWETSRLQSGASGILTNFTGGKTGLAMSLTKVPDVLEDIGRVHPAVSPLFDGNKALFNWGKYELAKGSYFCPKPGQYTSLVRFADLPELGGRMLFAGEHTSPDFAGYMAGAIQSGEIAARRLLSRKSALLRVITSYAYVSHA